MFLRVYDKMKRLTYDFLCSEQWPKYLLIKMSASNLGTIFATHIMCPRKLSPEALHATHQLLGKAVTFMIGVHRWLQDCKFFCDTNNLYIRPLNPSHLQLVLHVGVRLAPIVIPVSLSTPCFINIALFKTNIQHVRNNGTSLCRACWRLVYNTGAACSRYRKPPQQ